MPDSRIERKRSSSVAVPYGLAHHSFFFYRVCERPAVTLNPSDRTCTLHIPCYPYSTPGSKHCMLFRIYVHVYMYMRIQDMETREEIDIPGTWKSLSPPSMTTNDAHSSRRKITAPPSTTFTQQASPLLNLPAEIRNAIFEPGLPTATTILLGAQVQRNADGTTTYVFHPALPPLYAVRRQLRAEFIGRYYAENTFRFADTMFQFNALASFIAGRMPAIDNIRSIQASQWCQVLQGGVAIPSLFSYLRTRIYFNASMDAAGVRLSEVRLSGDTICSCTLQEVFEDPAGAQGDQSQKTLAAALSDYGRIINAYGVKAQSPLSMDGAKSCIRCRRHMSF